MAKNSSAKSRTAILNPLDAPQSYSDHPMLPLLYNLSSTICLL